MPYGRFSSPCFRSSFTTPRCVSTPVESILSSSHAAGFHPHHLFQLVGRNGDIVDGLVEAGAGVQFAAGILDHLEEFAATDIRGPFEHQMFEEVREARPVGLFVLGTDVIDNDLRDDGCRMVLMQDHVQAIRKIVLLELKVDLSEAQRSTPA